MLRHDAQDTSSRPESVVKKTRLIVTSADRDLSVDPSPSSYSVVFDEPLIDVISLSLVNATVPLVAYQVSACNNSLMFRIGADPTTHTATIPPGDYEPPSRLAEQVALAVETACGQPGVLSVAYVESRDAFVFSAAEPFEIICEEVHLLQQRGGDAGVLTPGGMLGDRRIAYASRTCARILGLGPATYASKENSPGVHVLSSPYRRDLSHTSMVILSITGADINVAVDGTLNRSFAVIGGTGVFPSLSDRIPTKTYNPPIGKMPQLHLDFRDVFGNAYDFQNQDHILEFVVTCSPRFQSKPTWTVRA